MPDSKMKEEDSGGDSSSPSTPGQHKSRRQKAELACVYCRRSHMTCDNKRPCSRCIRRSIGHLCHDELKPGKSGRVQRGDNYDSADNDNVQASTNVLTDDGVIASSQHMLVPSTQLDINNSTRAGSMAGSNLGAVAEWSAPFNKNSNGSTNTGVFSQALPFSHNNPVFFSEQAGSEFSSLNDFLSMIDDPLLGDDLLDASSAGANAIFDDVSSGTQQTGPPPSSSVAQPRQVPQVSESARDKFFLTAADPSEDISPEERLKQVIHAKVEAGLLEPFNYANGYTRLQKYMDNYMNHSSKQRILKPLSVFRPAFRGVAQSLKDVDLVLVEEAFERMLLDYDRVFTSMAIPACLWRRTGEIYRGNKEFAGLVEVNVQDLRDGKLTIYELMTEESAVSYWEKYGNIAFESGQKAVLTSCNLRTRDGRKRRACCFSFTVRRDRYNIPSAIIGNFIPIHH